MSVVPTPLRALLVALVAALTCLVGTTVPAQATAIGCDYSGGFGFSYQGVTLKAPKGYLCHRIEGDGRTVTKEAASYGAAPSLYGVLTGKVCNWRIDFVYYNTSGTNYRTDYGAVHTTCDYTVSRTVTADKTLAYFGKACARLVVNGTTRVTQCHNIIS
jgi:hypothetical protein